MKWLENRNIYFEASWEDSRVELILTTIYYFYYRVELEPRPLREPPRLLLRSTIQSWPWTSRPTRDFVMRSLRSKPRDWETRSLVTPPIWWREFRRDRSEVSPSSCRKRRERRRTSTFQRSLLWTFRSPRVYCLWMLTLTRWSSLWASRFQPLLTLSLLTEFQEDSESKDV